MVRFGMWLAGLLVLGLVGQAIADETKEELKELDKLQGYDQLRGEKGVKKDMVNVPDQPIESLIVWSDAKPTNGAAPLTVAFTADPPPNVSNPTYTWQFGDGSAAATGSTVSHTFAKPGVYKVLLKVTDASGDLGQDELCIKVTP